MNRWNIRKVDDKIAGDMASKSNLTNLCAKVLVSRGYTSLEAASKFIDIEELRSPFEILDMKKAADTILNAVDNDEYICIYGDYDCDGVTSTVILYSYLMEMGARVRYYIPERKEGYGMNKDSIKLLKDDGVDLIVTVDNGITAIEEAKYIKELGMKLVITDHHQQLDEIPEAEAVVDPHRVDDTSFFKYFCGAGLAMKLIAAMEDGDYTIAKELFSEIAAIGTVADVVSLTGENRTIVNTGLFYLQNTERPGLVALKNSASINKDKETDSTTISFTYAPRINAAGRMASPKMAVELLLAETEEEAEEKIKLINECNDTRKETEDAILAEIYKDIAKNPEKLKKRVLVVAGKDWHPGIIGIVASRVNEKFGMPTYVISIKDGEARGSARAFGEFSVFESLKYAESVLTKFGGHMSAGGFSLSPDKIEDFDRLLQDYAFIHNKDMPVYTIDIDALLMPEDITYENVEGLKLLNPFGEGNPEPQFVLANAVVERKFGISENKHTKFVLRYGNEKYDALLFKKSAEEVNLEVGDTCSIVCTLNLNEFNGRKSVSIFIKDYRKSGIKQLAYFASQNAYKAYIRGENLTKPYYKALTPTREELVCVYKAIKNTDTGYEDIFTSLNDISYGKYLVCRDIFIELGLIEYDCVKDTVKKLNVANKVDLQSSKILNDIKCKGE